MAVVAVTPDPPEVLARFASSYAIAYPILADPGGRVIEQFGVLNHNIVPNERQAAGIPFPGHFLLDTHGRILAKTFTGDLRHRASGTALVAETFDTYHGPRATIETDELHATIGLSTGRLFGGQEVSVRVDLDIAPGWHIYGADVTAPYQPLTIDFDTGRELVAAQSLTWPPPAAVHFDALDTTLSAHEGHVRATGRLRLRWSPPPSIFGGLDDAVRRRTIPPGSYTIPCALRYQACSETTCVEPRTVPFTLAIDVAATVHAPPPPAAPRPENP